MTEAHTLSNAPPLLNSCPRQVFPLAPSIIRGCQEPPDMGHLPNPQFCVFTIPPLQQFGIVTLIMFLSCEKKPD